MARAKLNTLKTPKEYVRLEARISPELKKLFVKASEMQGTSLTDFIVISAKKEAESLIKNHMLLNLSLKDTILLAQTIISDNLAPNAKLLAAANKFKTQTR